jgi:hypothetical protein
MIRTSTFAQEHFMFARIIASGLSVLFPMRARIKKAELLSSLINANSTLPAYCEKADDENQRPNFQYAGKSCFLVADVDGICLPFFDHTYRKAGYGQDVISMVSHRRVYVYCFGNTSSEYSHKVIVANQYIDDWEKIGDYDGTIPYAHGLSYTVMYASDAGINFKTYMRFRVTRK